VGLQAGPGFIHSFRKNGLQLVLFSLILIFTGSLLSYLIIPLFHIDKEVSIGLFTGALTSTPGLATADSFSNKNAVQFAYATVYPISMTFLILCFQLLSLL